MVFGPGTGEKAKIFHSAERFRNEKFLCQTRPDEVREGRTALRGQAGMALT